MLKCCPPTAACWEKRKSFGIARFLIIPFLIASCAFVSVAQENQPTTYAGFEGRNVSQVEIAKSPVMNVEVFRPLIKLQPGKPFSMAAIHDSVAALQKTALFSQVQVKIEPEQSGVHVTFLLQPTFYVGMVYFPGAKAFSYTRLLQGDQRQRGAASVFSERRIF
jgi:outer membrane protein assembly factor BamA